MSNCNKIINDIEDIFNDLGYCVENTFNPNQPKTNVVKGLFRFGGSLTKLAFDTTSCAIKNTPKAIVTVAALKKELLDTIEEEIDEYQKQQKIDALNHKIKQLKHKKE